MVVSSSRSREVIANDLLVVSFVFPAIKNLNAALQSFNLGQIPVSTTIGIYLLASSSPPSNADFSSDVKPTMQEITGFLAGNGFPLLVTAYPYFSYVYDPSGIPLSFVLLNSTDVVVRDGNLEYTNMFDAMVDAMYWALEKVGAGSVEVVICESGWPSNGNGNFTTIGLAQTYNQNLVKHVLNSGRDGYDISQSPSCILGPNLHTLGHPAETLALVEVIDQVIPATIRDSTTPQATYLN
ncbi:putative glucan endo-1,3-beta-glucosidase GVI [Tanacetum coccineum]